MSHCARAVSAGVALTLICAVAAAPVAAKSTRWEVTVAVRLADGAGDPVSLRLALPPDSAAQRLSAVEVSARGFDTTIVREGEHPHVVFSGRLRGARRVAATLLVEVDAQAAAVPPVWSVDQPGVDLLPFLRPAPLFQSRSVLVREFLETHAGPLLEGGASDPLRAILTVTREHLAQSVTGKSLALDVIRRGEGKRIGIERAFTTFLRCARVPARFVEGIRLSSSTRKKRTFWTEVWAQGRWWPVSASSGWIGKRPAANLALARDGTRVVQVTGRASVAYSIRARRVGSG
jgi:hypothetical protein